MALKTQVFLASGSFTVPTGVTALFLSSSGGGGGGTSGASSAGGGGGGASEHFFNFPLFVTEGQVVSITVGANGIGGAGSSWVQGTAGTKSTVAGYDALAGYGATDLGVGGLGGGASGNHPPDPTTGHMGSLCTPCHFGGSSGGHGNGGTHAGGSGGRLGGLSGGGLAGTGGGGGGSTPMGTGGTGGDAAFGAPTAGLPGTGYGAGGGGGGRVRSAANGSAGWVQVMWIG